jgi:hypothetical protein
LKVSYKTPQCHFCQYSCYTKNQQHWFVVFVIVLLENTHQAPLVYYLHTNSARKHQPDSIGLLSL